VARNPIDRLYEAGRSYPHGQARTQQRHPQPQRASDHHRHEEIQVPQAPEDQRAANYSNDVRAGWLRGSDGDGRKPSFDFANSWRRADGGNDWRSGSDPAVIRTPAKNKP
jgi:hypothetical protein